MEPVEVYNTSKFKEDILKIHNKYRAIHSSPPLRIDEKLNKRAQQLAKSLSKKEEEEALEEAVPYGENVYVGYVRDPNQKMQPEEPVQYWYQEWRCYDYNAPRPRNLRNVRNFTQLVWKDSKLMGIGIVAGRVGKVYLVCSYDPAANIDGKFQHNVAPPKEEDVQMPSLEELGLILPEPHEEVVRSMERIHAVPSEKLRVWMVWLTGVGEIADEWHKWLRAHIDLIAPIARRLQMDASDVPGGRKIESVVNAKSDEIPDNVMPTDEEERDVSRNLFDERTGEGGGKETTKTTGTTSAAASDTAKETATVWPIGTRWQPLTRRPIEREEDQMETIPALNMPKDETEKIEFLKNFTHQATLYRSYYKHWKEVADQAVKEIACKAVMTTAKFRRMDDSESAVDVAVSQSAQYSMRQVKSAVTHPTEGTTTAVQPSAPSATPAALTPMSNGIDLPADTLGRYTAEASIALSDDQSKVVGLLTEEETARMGAESPSMEPDAESPPPGKLDATARATQPKTATIESTVSIPPSETVATSPTRVAAKREAVRRLIRDMARADENIPYFFYLRAEPDMEIALEHNDEKVIPADPARERLSFNRRYLYFDLTDRPGRREGTPAIRSLSR